MSDIARARRLLEGIQDDLKDAGLRRHVRRISTVLSLMHRTYPIKKRAPTDRKGQRISSRLAREIRTFARKNPGTSQFKIAVIFNVRNQGRVSDAINGKI